MSLKHVDIESALRRLADRRIEDAMKEGKFANLPGAGQPLDLDPLPTDENARLMYWALRLLRQNDVVPHEVQWRKQIDFLRQRIDATRDEATLAQLVRVTNDLVRKVNTMGTNALSGNVAPLDYDVELDKLRARLAT
jgi:hypothetical protein